MSNNYNTQLLHFLDEHGEIPLSIPTEARRMGMFIAGIVSWMTTKIKPGITDLTNVPCIGKLHKKACLTPVMGSYESSTGIIHWECPACESTGVITNWELSQFDRRGSRGSV